jgi:hypothetical protein
LEVEGNARLGNRPRGKKLFQKEAWGHRLVARSKRGDRVSSHKGIPDNENPWPSCDLCFSRL